MSRRTVTGLTVFILFISLCFLGLFIKSQSKIYQAEAEAVKIVNYTYPVDKVNEFYWITVNEKQTYFSLDFLDEKGTHRYAIINQAGGDVIYLTDQDIISEIDAKSIALADMKPKRILQARLGLVNKKPTWEVTLKNNNNTITYYYLDAKTGAWVQKIENI
ncbi:PepSY domain-containing protein [Vaginisenegalia massiliensis]|uniref:PepSY domain-containing protein n=1 Tax=Vaginisenegalia massiliensis TaxID=2058294 RepID=UPI000F534549|nr:PepSY domain-containing protein [Vaginisenegalia massiliensis]